MDGQLVMTAPGAEAAALDGLDVPAGTIVLAGERLASSPGGYSALTRLTDRCGARLAWIPRRAGERGALEAGCLPNVLPGGFPVADAGARARAAAAWSVGDLPAAPGRDTAGILAAAAAGELGALVIGGVDVADLPDPAAALMAIESAPFVVSLELRHSAVTELADVVFPVAPVTEKAGSFLDWEGRSRPFAPSLPSNATSDARVLQTLADELGVDLGLAQQADIAVWDGDRTDPAEPVPTSPAPASGAAVLATWRMLLDAGRLQDGEPHLAGTARPPVVRLSAVTSAEIGAADGDTVTVRTANGAISLPLVVTDMPDRVVWLPMNSPGSAVHMTLGVDSGAIVRIEREDT
jgi:NADH-quinone oxidoreductase subunit G